MYFCPSMWCQIFLLYIREKLESVDITFADFDGVLFHVSTTPEAKNLLNVSISFKGAAQVMKDYGGKELLTKYYGALLQGAAEAGYDATLQVDLSNLPAQKGTVATFSHQLILNQVTCQ